MPVMPGRVFHPDTQSLLDYRLTKPRRRKNNQSNITFGHVRHTRYGHKVAQPFQALNFPHSDLGGMTEDELGGYQPHDRDSRQFYQAPPKLTSFTLQQGRDLWETLSFSTTEISVPNLGEALHSV